MKYEVIVTPEAEQAMEDAYLWLLPQTDQHAPRWYNGLIDALQSLSTLPGRFPIIPESRDASEPIHQFIYSDKHHGYRVQYCIRGQTVIVLQIRHAARKR